MYFISVFHYTQYAYVLMWVVLKLRSLDGEAGSSLDLSLDLEQTEEPPAQALRLQTGGYDFNISPM